MKKTNSENDRRLRLEGFISAIAWCPECQREGRVWVDPTHNNLLVKCPFCRHDAAVLKSHEDAQ